MAFAETLKKLREQHGMSQAELAERIGVAQPTVAQYESGIRVPNAVTAVMIAKRLGTTVEQLVAAD